MKYGRKVIRFYNGRDICKEILMEHQYSLPVVPCIGAEVSLMNHDTNKIQHFNVTSVNIRYETDDILHDKSSFNEVEVITVKMREI
jgi:hypothetical protein